MDSLAVFDRSPTETFEFVNSYGRWSHPYLSPCECTCLCSKVIPTRLVFLSKFTSGLIGSTSNILAIPWYPSNIPATPRGPLQGSGEACQEAPGGLQRPTAPGLGGIITPVLCESQTIRETIASPWSPWRPMEGNERLPLYDFHRFVRTFLG